MQENSFELSEKEKRQLAYFKKQKARPKPRFYLWYMLLILTLIYVVDEVATNLPNSLETEINVALFGYPFIQANGYSLADLNAVAFNGLTTPEAIYKTLSNGLSLIGTVKLIANITLIASMFYRPLADRYGRKLFLFINTLGMGAALLIIFLANNIWVYALGFFCLRFFVTPDQQVIYIFEIAPEKWRGTAASLTKGIAEFGLVFIWLLRKLFLNESSVTSYRYIFLSVAIAAGVISFVALSFSRESDVFLDSRIAYLEKSPEERAKDRASKDASKAQGGFIAAIRYAMKNKQLRWIFITTAVVEIAYSCCNNYANVLNNGIFGVGALSQAEATEVGFYFPFSCAIVTMLYGYIADKWGRKPTSILLLSLATVGFLLEFITLYFSGPLFLVGIFLGIVLGADWANGDIYAMMASESCMTNLRSSIMSVYSLFFGFGMVASMGVSAILPALIGKANIAIGYFALAVPAWIIGLVILSTKVKETKGTSLEKAGKEE